MRVPGWSRRVREANGALLTTNSIDDDWDYNVYFAGRTVWREQVSGSSIMPPMAVSPDRLGSNVKHFPFGDEPSTTAQNREKFATYFRDEVTALDYARNRYYSSTIARFTTADPYGPSARPGSPQTWNRYSYVGGDPVNRNDPSGLCDVAVAGINMSPSSSGWMAGFASACVGVYPFTSDGNTATNIVAGAFDVAFHDQIATDVVYTAIMGAYAQNPAADINITTFSGGAQAFADAYSGLPDYVQARINNVTYLAPGSVSAVPRGNGTTTVVLDGGLGYAIPFGGVAGRADNVITSACGHDADCIFREQWALLQRLSGSPCGSAGTLTRYNYGSANLYGIPQMPVQDPSLLRHVLTTWDPLVWANYLIMYLNSGFAWAGIPEVTSRITYFVPEQSVVESTITYP